MNQQVLQQQVNASYDNGYDAAIQKVVRYLTLVSVECKSDEIRQALRYVNERIEQGRM